MFRVQYLKHFIANRKLLAQNAKMTKKESESSLGGSKVEVEEIIHPQPREQRKTPKLLTTVLQVCKNLYYNLEWHHGIFK